MYGMVSADDEQVGSSGSDFFSPEEGKSRICLVPYFIPESMLTVPEDVAKRAEAGEMAAMDKREEITRLDATIKSGQQETPDSPARVRKVDSFEYHGQKLPGFMFPMFYSARSHYLESTKKTFLCKKREYERAGREPLCCIKTKEMNTKKYDAALKYGCVIVHYKTNQEGRIVIPTAPEMLGDQKVDFTYNLKKFNFSDAKMKIWKEQSFASPMISRDFLVWTEKAGNQEKWKFTAIEGPALWQRKGAVLFNRIMRDSLSQWEKIPETLGTNYTVDDIDKMFGASFAGAGAGAANLNQETDFNAILGGGK